MRFLVLLTIVVSFIFGFSIVVSHRAVDGQFTAQVEEQIVRTQHNYQKLAGEFRSGGEWLKKKKNWRENLQAYFREHKLLELHHVAADGALLSSFVRSPSGFDEYQPAPIKPRPRLEPPNHAVSTTTVLADGTQLVQRLPLGEEYLKEMSALLGLELVIPNFAFSTIPEMDFDYFSHNSDQSELRLQGAVYQIFRGDFDLGDHANKIFFLAPLEQNHQIKKDLSRTMGTVYVIGLFLSFLVMLFLNREPV